jgi:hypothetical protein
VRRRLQRGEASGNRARPYFFAFEPPDDFSFKIEEDIAAGFGFSAFGFLARGCFSFGLSP